MQQGPGRPERKIRESRVEKKESASMDLDESDGRSEDHV
jgi:hypothetical protein